MFERDVILVHGIKGVSYVLDLTESIIRYMIQMTEEESKSNTKQKIKKENLILTLKVVKDTLFVIAMASDLKHWIEESAYLITIPILFQG